MIKVGQVYRHKKTGILYVILKWLGNYGAFSLQDCHPYNVVTGDIKEVFGHDFDWRSYFDLVGSSDQLEVVPAEVSAGNVYRHIDTNHLYLLVNISDDGYNLIRLKSGLPRYAYDQPLSYFEEMFIDDNNPFILEEGYHET